jgi:hypothetical protein
MINNAGPKNQILEKEKAKKKKKKPNESTK